MSKEDKDTIKSPELEGHNLENIEYEEQSLENTASGVQVSSESLEIMPLNKTMDKTIDDDDISDDAETELDMVQISVSNTAAAEITDQDLAPTEDELKLEEKIKTMGTVESSETFNPMRMYDCKEREVSLEAMQMVYAARDHNTVLCYQPIDITTHEGERCLIIYIPNIQHGVEGLLPESKAGLRDRERLENLMRLPYVRVIPEWINREEGSCILNRELAEKVLARKFWPRAHEGMDVEGIVMGIRRTKEDKRPVSIIMDIHGINAVMRISEVSHNFVTDVEFRRGDQIKVRIIQKVEKDKQLPEGGIEKRRYLLVSKRALEVNPWKYENLIPKIGGTYRGKIVHISERLVHVDLPQGIRALCLQPSLAYKDRERLLTEKNTVEVHITRIDRDRRVVYAAFSPTEAKRQIEINRARQKRA